MTETICLCAVIVAIVLLADYRQAIKENPQDGDEQNATCIPLIFQISLPDLAP